MVIKKTSIYFYFGLVLCALIAIALRWKMLNFPLTTDEGAYAYITYFWQQGDRLYSKLWLDRPQGIFVIYRIIFNTFGYSTESIRLFAAVYNSATVIAIGLLGKKLYNNQTGLLASLFFAIFSSGILIEGFTANTELFISLPVVLSLYILLKVQAINTKLPSYIFLSGLIASFAFLIKASGISALFMGIGYLCFLSNRKNRLSYSFTFLLGYIAGLVPSLFHGIQNSSKEYFWAIFGWRASEYNLFGERFLSQFYKLWLTIYLILPEIFFFTSLLLCWLVFFTKNRSKNNLLVFIFLLSSILAIAPAGDWYRHYVIQLLPALSIIAASTIITLHKKKLLTNKLVIYLLVLGSCSFLLTYIKQFTIQNKADLVNLIYPTNYFKYELNNEISSHISSNSQTRDTVYVFFSESQIYFLSKRKPAYNKTFTAHVLTDVNFEESLIKIINSQDAPIYIINYKSHSLLMDKYPLLKSSIYKNYQLDKEIDEVELYRKRDERSTPN